MKHLFLTGERRIGKSTIVHAVMRVHDGPVTGFLTHRTNAFCPPRYSVHYEMLTDPPANGPFIPSEDNLLFFCGTSSPSSAEASTLAGSPSRKTRQQDEVTEHFDRMASFTTSHNENSLIVMDELGRHEEDSLLFRHAVMRELEGETPVIGVLQESPSRFLDCIAAHPNVRVLTVTKDNRDELARMLVLREEQGRVASYGAVVAAQSPEGPVILMVTGYHGLSFPKGHIEEGELPQEAAAREVLEETGITAEIDTTFYRTVKSALPQDRHSVTFFAARSSCGTKTPVIQENEIQTAVWIPVREVAAHIHYEPDRAAFFDIISHMGLA